jgi:hypothetical protein
MSNWDELYQGLIADDEKVTRQFRTYRRMYKKLLPADREQMDIFLEFLTNEIYRRLNKTQKERREIKARRREIEEEQAKRRQELEE